MGQERTRLGKYAITGTLGRGGMGFVYRGVDPVIQRTVAIKTVARDLLEDGGEQAVARFRNEARAAGRLSHPNIVGVYEYGEDGDTAFIAMEYVEGFGLKDFLRQRGKMTVSDTVGVMLPLLDGLAYAHEQGVVHRDIKPSNLIITSKGKVKIADFGIARIESSTLTQVGTVIGTPSYMSPEQFMGAPADARADIYAAGVVLFELLAGKRPFEGPVEAIASRICREPPPRISEVESSVPPFFDPVVNRALAKRPDDRYQSAQEFAEAVRMAFQAAFNIQEAPSISEDTVVRTVHMMRQGAGAQAGQAAQPTTVGTQEASSSQWQEKTLHVVERQLASFIGPMARVMVKRAANETTSIHELYKKLAQRLDTEPERAAFLQRKTELGIPLGDADRVEGAVAGVTIHEAAARTGTTAPSRETTPLSQELIDRAATALAKTQGPIARVLAGRAAKQAAGAEDFLARLAGELSDPVDRAAFLAAVGDFWKRA